MFVGVFWVLNLARSLWPAAGTTWFVRNRVLGSQLLDFISSWRPALVFPSCPLPVDLCESSPVHCL